MTTPEKSLKTYYGIKEVASMFNIQESTLRYWETQFSTLKPRTTVTNVRQYTKEDIEEIRLIYNLVKERGFKISAASKMIKANRQKADSSAKMVEILTEMKTELLEIKKQLDTIV